MVGLQKSGLRTCDRCHTRVCPAGDVPANTAHHWPHYITKCRIQCLYTITIPARTPCGCISPFYTTYKWHLYMAMDTYHSQPQVILGTIAHDRRGFQLSLDKFPVDIMTSGVIDVFVWMAEHHHVSLSIVERWPCTPLPGAEERTECPPGTLPRPARRRGGIKSLKNYSHLLEASSTTSV